MNTGDPKRKGKSDSDEMNMSNCQLSYQSHDLMNQSFILSKHFWTEI